MEIDILGFQRLEHQPYSPDLAPIDFEYFPHLKEHLRGQRFDTVDELMRETLKFNKGLGREWFAGVFDKWVKRYGQCI